MKQQKYVLQLIIVWMVWVCMGFAAAAQSSYYDVTSASGNYTFDHTQVPDALVPVNRLIRGGFQWERSVSPLSGFSAIAGATSATYRFPGPLSATTYLRRKSYSGNVYSNTIKIEVVSVNYEDLNYVREHNVLIAGITDWREVDNLPIGQKLQTTTYIDGLGRPVEKVSRETATPVQPDQLWGDVVQFSKYDALGRQPIHYLPFTTTTESGKFKTLPLNEQPQYYSNLYNETSAYSSTVYDGSPLNRVVKVNAPGTSWANSSGKSVAYDLNDAADDVQIFTIGYNSGDIPSSLGTYAPNTLFKNVHMDEKQQQVIEYSNISGQLILSKTQLADAPSASYEGWICTYSVYDDFGLLRYRLQPEAVKYLSENGWSFDGANGQKVLSELCFRYEYDDKGRTVLKKAPGAEPLQMLYDVRDRVVFMQDGNQRLKSEWTANLYDELDRPAVMALYQTAKSASDLDDDITNAATTTLISPSASTPQLTGSITTYKNPISSADLDNADITTVVKYNFYDDYTFSPVLPFSSSFDNELAYKDGDPIAASQRTTNMQTGSLVRVLGTNTFLATMLYYDDKGRPIQKQEENLKSGTDITTMQYQFDGRLLSSDTKHSTTGSGYSSFSVVTKNLFDKIGRVIAIQKKFGPNDFRTLASYDFDNMGRLKTKHLDPGYTGSGKNELESLEYSYNIHSEITGINKDYALKTPGKYDKWGNFFGLYLGYNNSDGVFAQGQLDGHVTGTLWTTQGDDVQRKYDFIYDNAGRLTSALFNEKQQPGDSWSHAKMDFSVTGAGGVMQYDLNGNLSSMLQKGVLAGSQSPVTVDDLHYMYASLSNKLLRVTDQGTLGTANGKLGDFADGSNTGDDYVYDANGNLVIDLNKNAKDLGGAAGGDGIRYNFLDKPEEVHISGKGTIRMVYDADGNKLQKIFTPENGGSAVTTTYINEYIYQGNDLQYINFEEGRIRVITPITENNGYDLLTVDGNMDLPGGKRGAYDFFIRDYQGNVRMILTEETHAGANTCTMETQRAANEEPVFGQVDVNGNPTESNEVKARFATADIPGQASGNGWQNSAIGDYVSRIGNLTASRIGPNTLLRVMAGDQVSATTMYYYQNAVINTGSSMIPQILSSLAQAITGSGVTSGLTKGAAGNITSHLTGSVPFGLKADPDADDASGDAPKAYLSVLFFDERFNFVEEGSMSLRVSQSGSGAVALVLQNLKAPKNGYAYVYVSNSSDEMVYFDNLQVNQDRGKIIEENHYYAYGLKITGISSRKLADASEGHIQNKDLYNDKELIDDADLDWYDYGFRNYDPQIGRFPQLDPLTDEYPELTPYQYGSDDPITNIDVDGLEGVVSTTAATAKWLPDVFVTVGTKITSTATINTAKWALHLGVIAARGSADALANANSLGFYDNFMGGNKHLDDYNNTQEQQAYLSGRIAGDGIAIAQGTTEIEGGGGTAAAGLATGPGALVISSSGALIALHGVGTGGIAAWDLAKSTRLLHRLYMSAGGGSDLPKKYNPDSKKSRGLWKLTEQSASRILNNKRFGKFFKSKSDGLWWSVDKAGHGGSKFKVFKENDKGLEWFKDADEFGDFISDKHKGETGKFIPWKELSPVK